jgi:DNA-binding NtrC family response regulator
MLIIACMNPAVNSQGSPVHDTTDIDQLVLHGTSPVVLLVYSQLERQRFKAASYASVVVEGQDTRITKLPAASMAPVLDEESSLEAFKRKAAREAVARCGGSKSAAAKALSISRSTIQLLLK